MESNRPGIRGLNQQHALLFLYLSLWNKVAVAMHPDCAIISHHLRSREICLQTRKSEERNNSSSRKGCETQWDEVRCWFNVDEGQVVNVSCSDIFQHFSAGQGYVSRSCTAEGWMDLSPPYEEACLFSHDEGPESETIFLSTFRKVYTVGYATSLVSLITAVGVFTAFRKFHCTRNYIHMNLFCSFILRASAVFIKDAVLFADETLDHCSMSTATCKAAVAFFQFSILANYFWLLVEGLYLQTLLALSFVPQRKYFWGYILIGWGLPIIVLIIWVLTRYLYDDRSCWDDTDHVGIWWIIKGPITLSLLVNIVIFINVIRTVVYKLKRPAIGGSQDTGHFMRLAKSTLFLIPLFGMHYTVFAFLPEGTCLAARLYLELGLGSFQGFVVAMLYCFMNGEVQTELRRWLWRRHSQGYFSTKRPATVTQFTALDQRGPPRASLRHSSAV
ncbi:vasoactive intestinal polypeptide receptor 1-like [Gadus chalcogrammus]|uniref:vasoactive intestinal polypeptide receptor 1-like n=1 Tax=Gadus chalcogrammus TaxID=1042646 RepID=UPI0024C4BE39|nr:vasoactive intestinal polypeptide receptor 1-like [Gadus chalcogrammus]